MATCMVQPPPAALTEAELFSSSRPGQSESGPSGRFIPSGVNRTGVFPMAHCFLMVQATFTERLIMVELMVLVLYTNSPAGLSANGTRTYSIASKRAATAIARSAILFLTGSAISMGLQARVVWAVAPSLGYGLCPAVSGPRE